MTTPKDFLLAGTDILDVPLRPAGFAFVFRDEGRGSGGEFAWGEYVRGNRRLELHFRASLGLVRYHVSDRSAPHEPYMRALGVWEQCCYPGFSENPMDGFMHLATDLRHANDFLCADAFVLGRVAVSEHALSVERDKELMSGYVGDTASRQRMRVLFRAGAYGDVLGVFATLKYPDRLRPAELKMVEVARQKVGG